MLTVKSRMIAMILILVMAVTLVCASCSEKSDDGEQTTTVPKENEVTVETTVADEPAETTVALMPLEVQDLKKKNMKIYWPSIHSDGHFVHDEIYAETYIGDIINDAVYERNTAVEEAYNVSIESVLEWCTTIPKNIQTQHLAGNVEYDAFCSNIKFVSDLAPKGMLADYNDLEYYSTDMPWWNDNVMKGFSLMGHRYFGAGDVIISDDYYPSCILANTDMLDDYALGDPYEIVNSGKWTYDKFMEMAKKIPAQLDGDEKWTYNDRYGITMTGSAAKTFYYGFGQDYVTTNADGTWTWAMTPEKVQPYIDVILQIFNTDNTAYYSDNDYPETLMPGKTHSMTMEYMYTHNQVLFQITTFIALERQLGSDVHSSILSIPKYDENQKDYINVLNDAVVVCIPSGAPDADVSSLVLSAMGRESVNVLTPAFYDTLLTVKYADDEDAANAIRLILATEKVPDVATTYNWGSFNSQLMTMAAENKNDFASYYKRCIKIAEKQMEAFVKDLNK